MRERSVAVEEVLSWLERETARGRFGAGAQFPSERALAYRLGVSRGAVREAKARLRGQGVLISRGHRAHLERQDAVSPLRQWLSTVSAEGDGSRLRTLKEALLLRRWVWPRALRIAVKRASASSLKKLESHFDEYMFQLRSEGRVDVMAQAHGRLVLLTTSLSRNLLFSSLAEGFLQVLGRFPVWPFVYIYRVELCMELSFIRGHVSGREGKEASRLLHHHLRRLDKRLWSSFSNP